MRPFGRRPSFERTVRPELPVLFRVARRMVQQDADAEDLVQKCLLQAFRAWSEFDGRHPRSWLIKILRNEALAQNRGLKAAAEFIPLNENQPGSADPWGQIVWADQCERIRQQLDNLPTDHSLAIQLCDVEELSYEEAADALDIPVGTLKSRLHRGRAMLRNRLIEQEEAECKTDRTGALTKQER